MYARANGPTVFHSQEVLCQSTNVMSGIELSKTLESGTTGPSALWLGYGAWPLSSGRWPGLGKLLTLRAEEADQDRHVLQQVRNEDGAYIR